MATIITYNNISLGFVKTSKVGQQAVLDQSGTDMLYTKFTISTRSVLMLVSGPSVSSLKSPAATGSIASVPIIAGEEPAATMARIRHMLLVPRRSFTMTVGSTAMISVDPFDGNGNALDDANGPKPISCDIVQITDGAFLIDYTIEVCLTDCGNLNTSILRSPAANRSVAVQTDWLSLRWTMSHDINEDGYSTISYQGGLICRSSILFRGGPDTLRGVVTPYPIPGFKRASHYSVSPDGLTLNFNITDTEMYLTPPPGTVKASGTHTVSTPNGALFMIDVNLHLEGRKETDKKTLMEMAVAIAYDKIQKSTPIQLKGLTILKQGSFQDEMYGPGVTVHLQAIATGPKKTTQKKKATDLMTNIINIAAPLTGLISGGILQKAIEQKDNDQQRSPQKIIDTFGFGGDPLGSSRNQPILMTFSERGYLPFLYLMAAYFNDPCLVNIITLPSQETKLNSTGGGISSLSTAPATISTLTGSTPVQSSTLQGTNKDIVPSSLSTLTSNLVTGLKSSTNDTCTVSIVGDLEAFDDTGVSMFEEDETTNGVWEYYTCRFLYHRDTGKRGFPAMKDGSKSVAYPKLYDDVMTVKVQWIAKKVAEPPTIPDPDPVDTNFVLLDQIDGYPSMELAPDGESLIYQHLGEYTYGVVDWSKINKNWPIPPWLAVEPSQLSALKLGEAIDTSTESSSTAADSQLVSKGA